MNLPLHIVSETASTLTLGWTPPAGGRGYVFTANGKKSHTLDPTRSNVKFAKPGPYTVDALGTLAIGTYPDAAPPVEPPAGQLANMWLEFGAPIPFKDGQPWGGFNATDYEGYGTPPNKRIMEVPHPLDPSKRAISFKLLAGDDADVFGGHRAEMYRKPGDLLNVSATAFEYVLTDTFRPPVITSTLFQNHGGDFDPSENQSPNQMFGIEPNEQMRWYVRGLQDKYQLGVAPRNVPIRGLAVVKHAQDSSGWAKFWLTTGASFPNETNPPTCSVTGPTSALPPGKPSYTKVGLYSQPLSPTTEAFLTGFGRADTPGRAKWLAGWRT